VVERVARAAGETPPGGVTDGGPAGQATRAQAGRVRARLVWAAVLAVAAVVLFVCYLRLSRTVPDNSDGADQALQAWDMLHGNWLLRGWTVGDVSYYTTEIPEYIAVEKIIGLGPDVIHVASAATYTLLVLLAGLLAKGRARGREGVVRALIASGILLAPELDHGVHLLISQPDHIGTQVPLLATFIVLDRARSTPGGTMPSPVLPARRGWYVPVAIAVMLTWVLIADRVAVFDAVLPLVVVCGLRAYWAIVRDGTRPACLWLEFSLMAAGIVSFGAAELVISVIKHAGGYTSLPLPSKLAAAGTIPSHVVLTIKGILELYGAGFTGLSPGPATAFAVVHLAGVALALWGFCRAFRRFFSTSDLIVPVMAAGIVFNLAFYVLSIVPATWFDTREIAAVLPFGAVLAGRQLAQPLARARLQPLLAGVLACYAAALGYGAVQPPVVSSGAPVADSEAPVVGWLEAHHLHTGLGAYTEANVITLDSGGRVAIRTVTWLSSGAVPRAYESEASWYDPRLSYANFVLTNSADSGGVSLIPRRDILALAGPPAHTYHYKTFTIMVWNHNLLADLGGPPSAKPGDVP
jgi:hypothetical protein